MSKLSDEMLASQFDILNDTGGTWRLNKFIEYHAKDGGGANLPLLQAYAKDNNLSVDERFWMSFLYSLCYSVPSTVIMYERLPLKTASKAELDNFWYENKNKLIFQSDKRWVKQLDQFVDTCKDFLKRTKRQPSKYFKQFKRDTAEDTFDALYKEVTSQWKYFGRFTAFLLIETIDCITPLKAHGTWIDWKKGDTATSGLLHIMYKDKEALVFDKTGKLLIDPELMTKRFDKITEIISQKYPEASTNAMDIETSLCGFRKLFKQSRYGGFYHDRALEEINKTATNFPEESELWSKLFEYRKLSFRAELLGELNDWNGIRKNLLKQWVEEGLTGVETVPY